MLSGNCTEALPVQAKVTISGSSAKLIKNGIAPLPFPLPALLKQYWYIKRGERVRVRGHAPFYATLGLSPLLVRVDEVNEALDVVPVRESGLFLAQLEPLLHPGVIQSGIVHHTL